MKYVVKVGYREYEFDDVNTATKFMEILVNHCTDKWIAVITSLSIRKGDEKDD